jgi:hypothetical protein
LENIALGLTLANIPEGDSRENDPRISDGGGCVVRVWHGQCKPDHQRRFLRERKFVYGMAGLRQLDEYF